MSNPVYGKQTRTSTHDEKRSSMFWVLIVGIILLWTWAPFQAALFNGQQLNFERPLYWAVVISSLLFIPGIVTYYKKFKLEEQRDWLAIIVLLLPLSYIISLITAASHYLAMNMVLAQCVYASIFILSLYLMQDRLGNKIMHTMIMSLAYIIVGFGFINWFGQWVFAGKLVGWFSSMVHNDRYINAVMTDSNGLRLTSVFQYANTYAAFLMAFLFAAVFCLMKSKTWYGRMTHAFMLVPILVSLFLTLSRGGLVLLPVVFVILLLFFKPGQQLLWIIHCAVAGIASVIVLVPITNMGLQLNETYSGGLAAKAWLILIAASAVTAAVLWFIQHKLAPKLTTEDSGWNTRRFANLWLPLGSVVVVAVVAYLLIGTSLRNILPENVQTRIEGINFQQHSVLERFTFYSDASKLLADYPVIGAGGGAWASLYETYQDYPYVSRQAHNFFIQYLVEVGILGFVIFMGFVLYVFYKYIRGYMKQTNEEREGHFLYVIITLSILVHSFLDFNLSYVFMGMLVFMGLGGMAAAMDSQPLKRLTMGSAFKPVYSITMGILTVIVLFTGLRYLQSNGAINEARNLYNVGGSAEQIQTEIQDALSIRPTHPESVIMLSSMYQSFYQQTQDDQFYNADQELLDRALKQEPYNKSFVTNLMNHYQLKNDNAKVFEILENTIPHYNWDINWYNNLIAHAYYLGNQAKEQQNTAAEEKYFAAGLNAYQRILEGVKHIEALPEGQLSGRAFGVTPDIALNIGKIQFISGQATEATTLLQGFLNEDLSNATNKEIARYYVAATQKLGQADQVWQDRLIQADPEEKQLLEQLNNMQ
ncbi:O-antigen ligase family protein [Paenibacillus massiliensis]|uniref:O-antigen ligase family protein n=1 Tax=Paenibacillus massiliensis TaxID=225917 RepID=UPI00048FF2A7|nr:O-antigen ligase family protein [Paenibacillus massiliensis]